MKLDQEELELTILKHLISSKEALVLAMEKGIDEKHFTFKYEGEKYSHHGRLYRLIKSYYDETNCLTTAFVLESKLVEFQLKDKSRGLFMLVWSKLDEIDEIDENDFPEMLNQLLQRYCMSLVNTMFSDVRSSMADENKTLKDILGTINERVDEIHEQMSETRILRQRIDISQSADWFMEEYTKRLKNPELFRGIPCGLKEIDDRTFGWMPGHLIVLLAPSSGGKSVQLMNWAINANQIANKNVLYFSFEMELWQCYMRHISCMFRIPYADIKGIRLEEDSLKQIVDKVQGLHGGAYFEYDVNLDDPTPEYIDSRIRELTQTKGMPDIIFVDYVGNMTTRDARRDAKAWEQQEEAGVRLFKLAKRYSIPIITAQQINRDTIRDNRKLREQGKFMSYDQAAAAGGQRLIHAAQYVMALEPDKDNNMATYHGVKMRDAQFDPFGVRVDAEHNGVYSLDAEDQEEWKKKRGVKPDDSTIIKRPKSSGGASSAPSVEDDFAQDDAVTDAMLDLTDLDF